MICRKFKTVLLNKTTNSNVIYRPLVPARSFSKWFDLLSKTNVTSYRVKLLREFIISRFPSGWVRSSLVQNAVRRCRKDRGMREVFHYFRNVFLKPRRTHLLVTVAAAYKRPEETPGCLKKCSNNIKDQEMEELIQDLHGVEELSKATLFCKNCRRRIIIDHKHPGVRYCSCPKGKAQEHSLDGWVPYMEAEDVVIWRKEYKPGGLYAYKVYGRYKHVKAEDFAMIQVDGAYRKVWDNAVASLSVVERETNGVKDQFVVHWEVLWPRLFANRDYVYLRRHKEFDVKSKCLVHKDSIFESDRPTDQKVEITERPNVHSHAKRISLENERKSEQSQKSGELKDNKVYVIVSRACVHPSVPETKNAIRVLEYWSHMVVTTINGPDEPGMEFVLTYYDEPAVGGLPTAITTWAMGRAGPAFLQRMRSAAADYREWQQRSKQAPADYTPFGPCSDKVSFENSEPPPEPAPAPQPEPGPCDTSEQDMESSKQGPDLDSLEHKDKAKQEQSAQTEPVVVIIVTDSGARAGPENTESTEYIKETLISQLSLDEKSILKSGPSTVVIVVNSAPAVASDEDDEESIQTKIHEEKPSAEPLIQPMSTPEKDSDKDSNALEKDDIEAKENTGRWWKYLYPLYYFV